MERVWAGIDYGLACNQLDMGCNGMEHVAMVQQQHDGSATLLLMAAWQHINVNEQRTKLAKSWHRLNNIIDAL